MPKGDFLGEFEQLILLAILRLRDDAYGMTIRQEIETHARRPVIIGAVYITLDRLQTKGYVSSVLGDATPERGGRAKRFYKVEAAGMQALHRSQQAVSKMLAGLSIAPEAV